MGSDSAFEEKFWSHIPKDKLEKCVSCGGETPYAITAPIDQRYNYVEGAGQLCAECFKKIYNKG